MANDKYTVVIVGDFFPVPSNFKRFSEGDIQYLFGDKICQLFSNADYRICNLEGALTDRPGKCEKTGPVVYAPTSVLNAIKRIGINCCTLANNHITDAGDQGVVDTLRVLDDAGIHHLGAGINSESINHFITFGIGDKRIGLYNVAETMYNEPLDNKPGAFLYDEYIVCQEIKAYKEKCDFLIVIYHGGTEKFRYPSPQTRNRFHRMVDSGANMVLSQHTHCVGSEEFYKGAYLLYGQGNFLFRSFNNEFTDTGLIIEVILKDGDFVVNKHLVDAIGDTVRYDEAQDFSSFQERSSHLNDIGYLEKEFQNYCYNEAFTYLKAFKGRFPFRRLFMRFTPKLYKCLVLRSYWRMQLLFALHTLRSEQNREVAIEGIKQLLKSDFYS